MLEFPQKHFSLFLILILVFVAACDSDVTSVQAPGGEQLTKVAPEATTQTSHLNGVTQYDGIIGGTNRYAILVPDAWNGDLILYAHGFVDTDEPLELPTKDNVPAIRDRYVADGYAFAYSSYRANGLAVKDGVWATQTLEALFRSQVKTEPAHTWLVAHSLGGLVAVDLAEKHPAEYDGLLTFSGMLGGSMAQLDYVGNVRILFDVLYPGVIPGSVLDVPEDYTVAQLMADVVAAVTAWPDGAWIISQIDQTPLPFTNGNQLVESLIRALGFNVRGIHDVLERTHGQTPIDNMDTVYTNSAANLPPAVVQMLNAMAQRYDRTPGAEAILSHYYEPTGRLTIPMVTLHDRWDPTVPLFSEELYEYKIQLHGNPSLCDMQVINRYGHCDFSADEAAAALADLVALAASTTSFAVQR